MHQRSTFDAGVLFARAEGILPAPEPTHAIRVAIDEALEAKEAGEARVILFNLCGHGHFDLAAYERTSTAPSRTTSTRPRRSSRRSPHCRSGSRRTPWSDRPRSRPVLGAGGPIR